MKKNTSFIQRNLVVILLMTLFWGYIFLSMAIPYGLTYFNRAYTLGYITELDTFHHHKKDEIDFIYTFKIDQHLYKGRGSVNENSRLHKEAISKNIKLSYVVVYCSIDPNINHMMLHCPKKQTIIDEECNDCFDNISILYDWGL